jgi:hypothetical protein
MIAAFQGSWQGRTKVHWTIQDSGEERRSSLPIGVADTVV